MDLTAGFRHEAAQWAAAAVAAIAPAAPVPALETPPDPALGDAALPCFPLAKSLRKSPAAIAAEVAAALPVPPGSWLAAVEAAGPYVNFRMDKTRLATAVLADPEAAMTSAPGRGRILLEHTSANPNGPLHVGRARNPILGDTIARILRAAGHEVEVQYYMDNLGRQVAQLYWGATNIPRDSLPPLPDRRASKPDHDLVRFYQAADELRRNDEDAAAAIAELVARLEGADETLLTAVRAVYEACFDGMRQSLARLGVTYDSVKDESDLVLSGAVEDVVARLASSPRAGVEEDGARFLDLADLLGGAKSTRFYYTRRDGTSVYATRDIAYHAWKAELVGPDGRLIDVLGEDHRLQSLQVGVALRELGLRPPDVAFYAFVSLPEGKMSTRANRVVSLDDLMDEAVERAYEAVRLRRGDELAEDVLRGIAEAVGIAALRYNIARVQPEKPIKFRWEDALDFDGDSAPYLMYAHARAASLLRKAAEAGITSAADAARAGPGEHTLLAAVAAFPAAVTDAADRLAPHRFAAYALQLASAFNDYYRDHPVIGAEDADVRALRLRCVEVARSALARALTTLGLPVLHAM